MGSESRLLFETFNQLKKNKDMKKFINDNLWWMLVISLCLGGYAAYKIYKAEKDEETPAAE